jgi:hypothetical protein
MCTEGQKLIQSSFAGIHVQSFEGVSVMVTLVARSLADDLTAAATENRGT